MYGKQLHIRPKAFLLCSIGIFTLCMLALLALFRSGSLPDSNAKLAYIISIPISALAAVAGAFVLCGLVQTIRGFRAGVLGPADIVAPIIIVAIIVLFILGCFLFPTVTEALELSLSALCLVIWAVDAARRSIRKRRERRNNSSNTLQ